MAKLNIPKLLRTLSEHHYAFGVNEMKSRPETGEMIVGVHGEWKYTVKRVRGRLCKCTYQNDILVQKLRV